mgnify:CR=1 FL=1
MEGKAAVAGGCHAEGKDYEYCGDMFYKRRHGAGGEDPALSSGCEDHFITSHIEYAIDAFELSVFRYVPKAEIEKRLAAAVRDAVSLSCWKRERPIR